jgi:hypothetical protein
MRRFLSESICDLKSRLRSIGNGSCIRVSIIREVLTQLLESKDIELKVGAVWMTGEEGEEGDEKKGREGLQVCFEE